VIDKLFESVSRNAVTITAQQNRVISESATLLSELPDKAIRLVLAEADLSPSDATRIFKTAVAMRSEKGLVTKAKDAYVGSADKIAKISTQIKGKLTSLVKAAEPSTTKLINIIKQGGPTATRTIEMIDSKIEAQVLKTREQARRLPRSYTRISEEIGEIEKVAKGAPQYGAFAVASLASATDMMKRNIAVPSIILYLSTVSEVMKGKKLSSALEKSVKDLGPADTASVNESDLDSNFELDRMRELAGADNVNEKFGFGDKPELSYDELLTTWNKRGRPTDIDEIKKILSSAGLSNREINKAFGKADVDSGEGSNPKVTRFANAIKGINLTAHVVDYLETMYPKEISESVQLEEAVISDSQIKQVLLRVSRVTNASDGSQAKAVRQYMTRWTREFAKTDDAERVAGEAVNYLHDRQEYEEYSDLVNAVTKVIRNSSKLDSTVKKNMLNDIAGKKLYKTRQTVRPEQEKEPGKKQRVRIKNPPEAAKEKPRARVSTQPGEKTRVRPSRTIESITLEQLQKVFEDAIIRSTKLRYGRTRHETL